MAGEEKQRTVSLTAKWEFQAGWPLQKTRCWNRWDLQSDPTELFYIQTKVSLSQHCPTTALFLNAGGCALIPLEMLGYNNFKINVKNSLKQITITKVGWNTVKATAAQDYLFLLI